MQISGSVSCVLACVVLLLVAVSGQDVQSSSDSEGPVCTPRTDTVDSSSAAFNTSRLSGVWYEAGSSVFAVAVQAQMGNACSCTSANYSLVDPPREWRAALDGRSVLSLVLSCHDSSLQNDTAGEYGPANKWAIGVGIQAERTGSTSSQFQLSLVPARKAAHQQSLEPDLPESQIQVTEAQQQPQSETEYGASSSSSPTLVPNLFVIGIADDDNCMVLGGICEELVWLWSRERTPSVASLSSCERFVSFSSLYPSAQTGLCD